LYVVDVALVVVTVALAPARDDREAAGSDEADADARLVTKGASFCDSLSVPFGSICSHGVLAPRPLVIPPPM